MAAPVWLRYLPPSIGGRPDLSENMVVIDDPSFSNEFWRWPEGEWNVTISSEGLESIVVQRESTGGYPPETGDGCLIVSIRRSGSEPLGNVTLLIYKEFEYPYLGPPKHGRAMLNLFINGTVHQELRKVWNVEKSRYEMVPKDVPDVPAKISMFAMNSSGYKFNLWPSNRTVIFNASLYAENMGVWDSVDQLVNADLIFQSKGYYIFGLEVMLNDFYYNATREVELKVNIDNLGLKLFGTSWGILGSNMNGYDLWSQLVHGARVSLYVGVVTAALSVGIGLIIGLASGYLGRIADEIMMRVSDVLLVLPTLPLLMVLFNVLGRSIENLIILLSFLGWMGFAKVVRSQVLSIRERAYIEAAKAAGAGTGHILLRHVLPNVMGLVYVTLATSVPGAIVAEAALSYLGFYDPFRMSWGRMLEEMQAANAVDKWWWVIPPGMCIAALSIAFVLLGYALDEVLNPKLRQRR
jgi:ABC-type dipeptide/oligopeptide/nickel transport system permease subunit